MDLMLTIALLSIAGWAVTLVRHILFKRQLLALKSELEDEVAKDGLTPEVWVMFRMRTTNMLSFWR
jgi:hypothetical protein